MLSDITLGQYFPGNSLLHKLDPRTKIILAVFYIVLVFLANSVSGYIFAVVFTAVLALISRIPIKTILRGMKPLLFVIIFTAVVNIFWTTGEVLLVDFYFIKIYLEGVIFAVLMAVRIASLLTGTCVILTYTTSPISLTDGLERLLGPLKKIKVPVHEFTMMMTIALRFTPTLIEETDKIMKAQKARGADFSSGSLIQRAKAMIPILIPLFISSFRRADDLAIAMECRCYRGGEGRTKMTKLKMSGADFTMIAVFAAAAAAILLLNRFLPIYSV